MRKKVQNFRKIFKDYDQNQSYLLPPSLNEFVGPEHPARIISDVVDSIDVSPITKKYNGGGQHSLSSKNVAEGNNLRLQ